MTADINSIYLIALPIVFALIGLEAFISSYLNMNVYKTGDTLGTIGLLSGNILVSLLIKGSTLAFHFFLYQFKLIDLISVIPIWLHWVLTFIFIDLSEYPASNKRTLFFFEEDNLFAKTQPAVPAPKIM